MPFFIIYESRKGRSAALSETSKNDAPAYYKFWNVIQILVSFQFDPQRNNNIRTKSYLYSKFFDDPNCCYSILLMLRCPLLCMLLCKRPHNLRTSLLSWRLKFAFCFLHTPTRHSTMCQVKCEFKMCLQTAVVVIGGHGLYI